MNLRRDYLKTDQTSIQNIDVNNTSKDSFLKTQVECSLHSPINKITWSNNKNIINCSMKYPFTEKNIETISGPNKGYPWNEYLHMYFNNGVNADCNNKPLLGMKFITDSNGKYSIEYNCSNDDTTIFSQVKDFQYKDLEKSSYSSTENDISIQNNNFIDNDWLRNTQKVYTCPENWFLSKIGGSTRNENSIVYNNYNWTCGTFFNNYKNSDGDEFQWRYYKKDKDIYMQIVIFTKILNYFNDPLLYQYNTTVIDFDITYNITKNVITYIKKRFNDDTALDHINALNQFKIENNSNLIELTYDVSKLSFMKIKCIKGDFTIFDNIKDAAELSNLPLCFTKMSIIRDVNLPKIKVFFIMPNGAKMKPNIKYKLLPAGLAFGNGDLPECTLEGGSFRGWYQIKKSNQLGKKYYTNLNTYYNNTVLTAVFVVNKKFYYKKFTEAINNGELDKNIVDSIDDSDADMSYSLAYLTSEDDSDNGSTSSKGGLTSSKGGLTSSKGGLTSSKGGSTGVNSSTSSISGSTSSKGGSTSGSTGVNSSTDGNNLLLPIILLIVGVIIIVIGFFIKQYIIIVIGIIIIILDVLYFFATDKE